MQNNNVVFLNQLVTSLEEAEAKLEEAQKKNDFESFEKIKKLMAQIQKKISEVSNEK